MSETMLPELAGDIERHKRGLERGSAWLLQYARRQADVNHPLWNAYRAVDGAISDLRQALRDIEEAQR